MTQKHLYISPVCECAIEQVVTFQVSEEARQHLEQLYGLGSAKYLLWMRKADEDGHHGAARESYNIVNQCVEHLHHKDVATLWEELHHNQVTGMISLGCPCQVALHYDDRHPDVHNRPMTCIEYPFHTKRCAEHAHIEDSTKHHKAVQETNLRKQRG